MADPFKTSDLGIEVIAFHEGFSPTPYFDFHQFSIGFGSGIDLQGNEVTPSTPAINRRQAETLLTEVTLPIYERGVANSVVRNDLPVDALSALVSFAYNLGVGAFRSSTLLRRIEASQWGDVKYQFSRWVKAGGQTFPGLQERRMREFCLFSTAVVAAGIAETDDFGFDHPPVNPQSNFGYRVTPNCDVFDAADREEFKQLPARLEAPTVSQDAYNQTTDNTTTPPTIVTGPFFPRGVSGDGADADSHSAEAIIQQIVPVVAGPSERKFQAPLIPAGVPMANGFTMGGTEQPVGLPVSPNVRVGGNTPSHGVILNGAAYPRSGNPPDILVATKTTVLVNGVQIGRTLDPVGGGVMGVGVPNVIMGNDL